MSRIFLSATGAGTWTVPSDWDSANNTIELIGAGANGTNQFNPGGNVGGGQGGGGGQYAKIANLALTPGAVINFHIGAGGANNSSVGGTPSVPLAWDTWFNTAGTVFAQGAWTNPSGNLVHGGSYHPPGSGLGGGAPFPWAWNDGGSVPNVNAAAAANGGGGAGGPHGPGAIPASASGLWEGASAGAGANGGAAGGQNFNSGGGFVGYGGGDGGNNRLGSGGGLGSAGDLGGPLTPAQPGADGGGGGGGYGRRDGGGSLPPSPPYIPLWGTDGANGSTDAVWGGIYGPGGGGGGGGGGDDPVGPQGGVGGNGGQFGGGGGGSATVSGPVGLGGQGLIIITYLGTGSADGRGRLRTRYVRKAA